MNQKFWTLFVVMIGCGFSAFCIKATTTHTLFYKKNLKDSSKYDANIVLAWRVENNSIHYKTKELKFESEIICLIRISKGNDIIKDESFNIKTPPKATPEEVRDQIIADQYEYTLPTGKYDLELILYEPEHKSELYQFNDTFSIAPIEKEKAALSGIQLLDRYFKSKANTVYSKNGFLNLPLPSNFLSEKRDSVFFYFEVYQANKIDKKLFPIKTTSYISFKPYSLPVAQYERIDTLSKSTFHFRHIGFPLQSLASGNYYINVVLSDKYDLVIDKRSLFIQRYNTDTIPKMMEQKKDSVTNNNSDSTKDLHVLDLTNTFVGKYTASQVRAIMKMLLLICDPTEALSIHSFLDKPDELYSKYFIFNFWEKRNKQDPEKPWKAFTERIKEVNRLFRGSGIPGYETERGRVYIQYGKPNDRLIVNNEMGALPYEIWQYYNIEKQGSEGIFLFYKSEKAVGDYALLHSTVVGETRNGSWRSLLYNNNIMGSGAINTNSQAEQYIGNK